MIYSIHSQADKMPQDLQRKQAKMAALTGELADSWNILSMFPDAFAWGPVKFTGLQKQMPTCIGHPRETLGFIKAYFVRGDGVRLPLTKEQLLTFRPDALVHPEYR